MYGLVFCSDGATVPAAVDVSDRALSPDVDLDGPAIVHRRLAGLVVCVVTGTEDRAYGRTVLHGDCDVLDALCRIASVVPVRDGPAHQMLDQRLSGDLDVGGPHMRTGRPPAPALDVPQSGFVGDVDLVNGDLLADLIHKGIVPVMAPLTHDGEGHILNTNADTIAGETAKALAAHFDVTLIYSFEKKGVLKDANDDESFIPHINEDEFRQYVADGIIQGGMIPKLENAFDAIHAGVSKVIITEATAIDGKQGTIIEK